MTVRAARIRHDLRSRVDRRGHDQVQPADEPPGRGGGRSALESPELHEVEDSASVVPALDDADTAEPVLLGDIRHAAGGVVGMLTLTERPGLQRESPGF